MADTLPERVRRQYGRDAGMLNHWRTYGWLGGNAHLGMGQRFPWDDDATHQQIAWLSRLAHSGRNLDAEDAAGGFRLRAQGHKWALRVGMGRWAGYDDLALMLTEAIVARQEPCTVIRVIF